MTATCDREMTWTSTDRRRGRWASRLLEEALVGRHDPRAVTLDLNARKKCWINRSSPAPRLRRAILDGGSPKGLGTFLCLRGWTLNLRRAEPRSTPAAAAAQPTLYKQDS